MLQQLKIEHKEYVKKAKLKCLIPDFLMEEDLITNDELDSASSKVEIRQLELEYNAREEITQRE